MTSNAPYETPLRKNNNKNQQITTKMVKKKLFKRKEDIQMQEKEPNFKFNIQKNLKINPNDNNNMNNTVDEIQENNDNDTKRGESVVSTTTNKNPEGRSKKKRPKYQNTPSKKLHRFSNNCGYAELPGIVHHRQSTSQCTAGRFHVAYLLPFSASNGIMELP